MKFWNLASSSRGNCYVIEFATKQGNRTFLIECGINRPEMLKRCLEFNLDPKEFKFCLLTHSHSDHSKCARDLRMKIYTSLGTQAALGFSNADFLKSGETRFLDADIKVTPFAVEHDCDEPLGFIIESSIESLLFTIDCKYYKADISSYKFDYIMTECNYDHKQVYTLYHQARKEHSKELIKRYERLLNSHMSLASTLKHLKKLNLSKCKAIFLTHLSDGHANEIKMKNEVYAQTGIPTYVCRRDGGII